MTSTQLSAVYVNIDLPQEPKIHNMQKHSQDHKRTVCICVFNYFCSRTAPAGNIPQKISFSNTPNLTHSAHHLTKTGYHHELFLQEINDI